MNCPHCGKRLGMRENWAEHSKRCREVLADERISLSRIFHIHCVEPVKRNKDGMRWIIHRFPIKGGISLREAWLQDLYKPMPLWHRLILKELSKS